MFAKWIVCRVAGSQRSGFSDAQLKWRVIDSCDGFRAQFGGFCGEDAHILCFWSDRARYERFMGGEHELVVRANRQHEFYSQIQVHLLSLVMDLPLELASVADAVPFGAFARLAACTVHEARVKHFLAMQHEVWLPAMARAPGVLGAALWSFEEKPNCFLVSSLWRSEGEHNAYSSQTVPQLRQRSMAAQDLASVRSCNFSLERPWSVSPSARCAVRIEPVDHTVLSIAQALYAVQMKAYRQEAQLLGALYFPPLQRTVHDVRTSREEFLAAFTGPELMGAVGVCPAPEGGANIASLVVAPDRQRQGVGRRLLAGILEKHGRTPLTVQTGARNLPALALYTQAGFIEVQRRLAGPEQLELVTLSRPATAPSPAS